MKVLIFLQGTVLVESNVVGSTREESVRKFRERAVKKGSLGELIFIGHSPAKIASWKNRGSEIIYMTASRKAENVLKTEEALRRWSFPEDNLISRRDGESSADAAVRARPDVIVEDDCESIGGTREMVYPNLPGNMKQSIASVVVREFEGIDHLPDDPELLAKGNPPRIC